jgi:4,5-dihydroxyphthalate decarboxylase
MADLHLSFAMTPYDRVLPLISGEVKPDGITLDYQGMPGGVPGVFYDQLKFGRYDLSEFSFSEFLHSRPEGLPYQMLPVFHNRSFSYTWIIVRAESGIRVDHPEDLRGKRIGTGDFHQTAALWTRGILQHEFGVAPTDMIWYQERAQRYSHGGAVGLKPPPGIELHYAQTDFATMMLNGELDACIWFSTQAGSALDRQRSADLTNDPRFPALFSDIPAEGTRYYQKNGIFPPHHITIIRESIAREHPWIARSLMEAFNAAKAIAIDRIRRQPPTLMVFGAQWLRQIRETFGDDPFVYGVGANARAIDTVQTYSMEQGLSQRKQPWDELFPEEILLMEERLPSQTAAAEAPVSAS